jgi:hypothetical protein
MPLVQYRIIHWNARITDVDIDSLSQWARQSTGSAASQIMQVAAVGDAVRGKDVFERRCTGCHSLDQNREGPRLRWVFGRISGTGSDHCSLGVSCSRRDWRSHHGWRKRSGAASLSLDSRLRVSLFL